MVASQQPLTDSQWQVIAPLLPLHRKRRLCLRCVTDALLYVCRTGCQWRNLPPQFLAWTAVYYYFLRWQQTGTWVAINAAAVHTARVAAGREAEPSLAIVDSHSLRLAPRIFEQRGTDGGKLVNGRKRQLLVEADGRILAAHVHAANGADTRAARAFGPALRAWKQRLRTVLTDAGYRGAFARHITAIGLRHEVAARPPTVRGFVPLKRRWVVERTFAWLTFFRRLSHDREHTPASHEAWIYVANLALCLNQLTGKI